MKKTIIISSIVTALVFTSSSAFAKSSTEEDVGFFSGAITGAVMGGPVGFLVGGIAGVLLGGEVEKANQLEQTSLELEHRNQQFEVVQHQLNSIKQQMSQAETELKNTRQWISQGLSLNLLFTTNSTQLSDNDILVVAKLAKILNQYPEINIRLDGFADPRGPLADNYQLSLARANTVKSALIAQGVADSRLILQAHGESNATNLEPNPDNFALERRVSVKFIVDSPVTVAQN